MRCAPGGNGSLSGSPRRQARLCSSGKRVLCQVCLIKVGVSDGVVEAHMLSGPVQPGRTELSLCPMSGKPVFEWSERSTREAVAGRSNGRCEWCGATATNIHHRKNVSQGGLWSPVNCLHICGSGTTGCHGYFTQHPEHAYRVGVSVHRNEDPADVPVLTPNGPLWLSDDISPPLPGWAR